MMLNSTGATGSGEFDTLYDVYMLHGFKALRCKGYNGRYNPKADYKTAKQPVDEGYTDQAYKGLSLAQCSEWIKEDGWIGWLIPEGYIGLDAEDSTTLRLMEEICDNRDITPPVHLSNNGEHIIFKTSKRLSASTAVYTKCGLKLTYRVGGRSQLILAPINGRSWRVPLNGNIPELPDDFLPYDPRNVDDVLNVLSWGIGDALRSGYLNGYDDVDTSFMALLVECNRSRDQIHKAFKSVFLNDYDCRKTEEMFERTAARLENSEPLRGTGSLIDRLKPHKALKHVVRFVGELQQLTVKCEEQEQTADGTMIVRAVSIRDFLTHGFPPRKNILAPWLHTQGLCMVYGQRGVGKTYFGLRLAIAVTAGDKFLRWEAEQPRGVLYIDGEMPGVTMQERLSRIICSASKEPISPFKIITPDLQESGMPNLSTEVGQQAIEPHLNNVSLVIVDNISTLCRSGRENEGESWLPIQEWALKLRRRGFAVLFMHHANKLGEQRGTSRREDVLDAVIALRHPQDYQPNQGARFMVKFEKARGIYGDDVRSFEAMLTADAQERQVWTMKDAEESLTERVAELLKDGLSQREVAEEVSVTPGTVSKHKKKAQEKGLLS